MCASWRDRATCAATSTVSRAALLRPYRSHTSAPVVKQTKLSSAARGVTAGVEAARAVAAVVTAVAEDAKDATAAAAATVVAKAVVIAAIVVTVAAVEIAAVDASEAAAAVEVSLNRHFLAESSQSNVGELAHIRSAPFRWRR